MKLEDLIGAVIIGFEENTIGFDEIIVEKEGKRYKLLVEFANNHFKVGHTCIAA